MDCSKEYMFESEDATYYGNNMCSIPAFITLWNSLH
jgi:hypothetical protein